ncbi:hypothetical protein GCM10020331_045680 [Ectobacillus funiculus]
MEQLARKLREANVGKVLEQELLARHTTMKIGGPADIMVIPSSIEGVHKTLEIVKEQKGEVDGNRSRF